MQTRPTPPFAESRRRRFVVNAAILGAFVALSVALFGRAVLANPAGRILSDTPEDAAIFVWAFRWWPFALAHGLDPMLARTVWAPGGANLFWITSVPLPSLLLAPLTAVAGPVVAYDVASLLAPALTGWTTSLLCRRLGCRLGPAVAGGLVAAFSPGEVSQVASGHLNLSLLVLPPLAAYLAVRRAEGSLGRRGFVGLLGVALAAQLGVSTEVAATTTALGGVALALGLAAAGREHRRRVLALWAEAGAGVVLAGLTALPFLVAGFVLPHPRLLFAGGAAAAVPRPWSTLGGLVAPSPGTEAGRLLGAVDGPGAALYLGIPMVALLAYLCVSRRHPAARFAGLLGAAAAVAGLGPALRVAGHSLPLPWAAAEALPLLGLAVPSRLFAQAAMAGGVGLGLWLSGRVEDGSALRPSGRAGGRTRTAWRWAAAALLGASILPSLAAPIGWTQRVGMPAFFAGGAYRRYLSPGEIVLVADAFSGRAWADFRGEPMLWQAETNMAFRQAGGFLGLVEPAVRGTGFETRLADVRLPASDERAARRFLLEHRIDAVIDVGPARATALLARLLGVRPLPVGGVMLFQGPFGPPPPPGAHAHRGASD